MQSLEGMSLSGMGENVTSNVSRHSLICGDSGASSCAIPVPKLIRDTIVAYSPGFVHEHNAFMTGSIAVDIIRAGIRRTEPTSCGGKNSGHAPPINGIRCIFAISMGIVEAGAEASRETLVSGTLPRVDTQPTSNVHVTSAAIEERMEAETAVERKSSRKIGERRLFNPANTPGVLSRTSVQRTQSTFDLAGLHFGTSFRKPLRNFAGTRT